jgi:lysophospholipase L1-like esterase
VASVIACDPDVVIVLIGANDALTMVFENARRVLTGFMHHSPRPPSAEWFGENLHEIVRRLKQETRARIGLSCTGGDETSAPPPL